METWDQQLTCEIAQRAQVPESAVALCDEPVDSRLYRLAKAFWRGSYERSLPLADSHVETAAFTLFLFARMTGCAAEIDDHLNRGRNMDMRTAASACKFIC